MISMHFGYIASYCSLRRHRLFSTIYFILYLTRFSIANKKPFCGITFSNNRWSLSGQWVPDYSWSKKKSLTNVDCSLANKGTKSFFIRGCCGSDVGVFELFQCKSIPNIFPLLRTLRGRHLLLVGDSLQQQTFDALILTLDYVGIEYIISQEIFQIFPQKKKIQENKSV